jgi:hypothetical protein
MSKKPVLPVLDGSGWCTDPSTLLIQLFKHMVVAEFSQSNIFYGKITSLPYLISLYQKDPDTLVVKLESALKEYIGAYLSNVIINIKYIQNPNALMQYSVNLSISGYYDNVYCDLSKEMLINNGQISNMLALINE